MPEEFQDFLISDGYSEKQLQIDATLPDSTDKDNITQDAEIHHAHSYKLELREDKKLYWKDGDVLERLKGLCADAHDFKAENRLDMVRYCLGKMTHYRVDALTYPHLFYGKPWNQYHEKFETEMGHFVNNNQDRIASIPFQFKPYKDIYKESRKTALLAWYQGFDLIKIYGSGNKVSDEQALEICKMCIQGVGDLWTTLGKEMKIILKEVS